MIPKIIHYCWFGDKNIPEEFERYIKSWKQILPEYKFVLWNEINTHEIKSRYLSNALNSSKYAFASDYTRLYALYNYGGIYLDCDVEVIRTFNDLLSLPYFVGKENTKYMVDSAVIGSEKGCSWIKECLECFDEERINESCPFKEVLPSFLTNVLKDKGYNFVEIDDKTSFKHSPKLLYLFPTKYFCPKNYYSKKIVVTPVTYCIHHFAGSWQPLWKKWLLKGWIPFSIKFPKAAEYVKKNVSIFG